MSTESGRLSDVIAWSWAELHPELAPPGENPVAALPSVDPETTTFYWELHFQNGRVLRADFLHRPSLISDGAAGEDRSFDPILPRLRAWYQASALARTHVHDTVWLEADGPLVDRPRDRPQGVSVCLDPTFGQSEPPDRPPLEPDALAQLYAQFEAVCGCRAGRAADLLRVHGAVSAAGGELRHISIMRGRPRQPLKVYAAVPKPSLPALLSDLEWAGDRERARACGERVAASSRWMNIDLLVDDGIAPRIGFELFSDPSAATDFFRSGSLELAVELRLMTREQAAGLRTWVGRFRRRFASEAWPTAVRRWFDMKFVQLESGEIELKTYLGFRLQPSVF